MKNYGTIDRWYPMDSVETLFGGSGVAFPLTTNDGLLFYRTDITDPEWFFYDDGRSKWLSLRDIDYEWGFNTTRTNNYLKTAGQCIGASGVGYVAKYDVTALGVSASMSSTGTGTVFRVYDDGVSTAVGVAMGSETAETQGSLNVDYASGSVLSGYVSGSTGGKCVMTARFKRHET